MPKPRFQVIVGMSNVGPREAARDAESKARKAKGEQIGIAADVCCGSAGTDPQVLKLLNNIAQNIFKCQCKSQKIIGETIKVISQGIAPPRPSPFTAGATGASRPVWVVYILLKH